MKSTPAQLGIWLTSLGVSLFTIAVMIRRGLIRRFWFQFLYICFNSGLGVVVWVLSNRLRPSAYTLVYWSGQGIILISSFVAVYYYWRTAFIRYRGLHRLCVVTMLATLAFELIVLFFTTSSVSGPGTIPTSFAVPNWLQAYFFLVQRSAMFVLAGLLWLFFGILALWRVETSRTLRNFALGMFVIALSYVVLDSWVYVYAMSSEIVYLRGMVGLFANSVWCYAVLTVRDEAAERTPLLTPVLSPEEVERRMQVINLALLRMTGSPEPK